MKKVVSNIVACACLCLGSSAQAASVANGTYLLRLVVPEICKVQHHPGLMEMGGGAYALGGLKEYCNTAGGYSVVVTYAPGTMKGATLTLGSDSVVLNGSGTATISHAGGPRIIDRELVAVPGENGFDTDVLNFEAVPG
jgi:hypothetical protein